MKPIVLPPKDREHAIAGVSRMLAEVFPGKPVRVKVEVAKKTRTDSQNRTLWGLVYPAIMKAGGETLGGWEATDLHEFFLIEHYGSEIVQVFGRKRHKPLRRSSSLSTVEFAEHVEFIQRFCAQQGIYVPDPNEDAT